MGAFNSLGYTITCPSCSKMSQVALQFKYGEVWQYNYKMGEPLRWGERNVGSPDYRVVVVLAIAENCPVCNASGGDYEIWVENGTIVAVEPFSGKYDFSKQRQEYIVIG